MITYPSHIVPHTYLPSFDSCNSYPRLHFHLYSRIPLGGYAHHRPTGARAGAGSNQDSLASFLASAPQDAFRPQFVYSCSPHGAGGGRGEPSWLMRGDRDTESTHSQSYSQPTSQSQAQTQNQSHGQSQRFTRRPTRPPVHPPGL
jgi:hypothetical protein